MSKKEVQKIQDQIRELNNQLVELGHDPVAAELEDDILYQKNALADARAQLKSYEEDVRWWNKEIVKIEGYLVKLEAMRAKNKAKKKKPRRS